MGTSRYTTTAASATPLRWATGRPEGSVVPVERYIPSAPSASGARPRSVPIDPVAPKASVEAIASSATPGDVGPKWPSPVSCHPDITRRQRSPTGGRAMSRPPLPIPEPISPREPNTMTATTNARDPNATRPPRRLPSARSAARHSRAVSAETSDRSSERRRVLSGTSSDPRWSSPAMAFGEPTARA